MNIRVLAWDGERMIYDSGGLTVGQIIDWCENVMLWTGYKDTVTGAEIWEGDMLKTCYGIREVQWGEYAAAWVLERLVNLGDVSGSREVVGNIWEGEKDE